MDGLNHVHITLLYTLVSQLILKGYNTFLLGFSPFENEQSQGAHQHTMYVEYVLNLFGKDMSNVVALCGDNCYTNKAFVDTVNKPLVGCSSHRYNLAVQDIFSEHKELLKKVNELMKRLRSPIMVAYLRKHTHLRAKCMNTTRWNSTSKMLKRYQKIKSYIPEVDLPTRYQFEIDDMVPSHRENKILIRYAKSVLISRV